MIPLHDDNPTRRRPWITWLIIISCIAAFLWQLSAAQHSQAIIMALGVKPAHVLHDFMHSTWFPTENYFFPAWLTLFTSQFLHGGWLHLIGNMWFLFIFGNNIEDAMGHGRFIIFYLLCGALAALTQVWFNPQSLLPMIGASGAISGVLGAYLLLYPRSQVLVAIPLGIFIHTTRIAAGLVLMFWFVFQLINSWLEAWLSTAPPNTEGGVAWAAHIGGFVAGMLLIPLFKHRKVRFFNPARRR
ncbi:MAG: rhomboid family intramembrane serine protease [Gammaproteobacteria bacterium]|nr:rhomboid family intramembrane serine protease [Gammaproteobacteria bacterium]